MQILAASVLCICEHFNIYGLLAGNRNNVQRQLDVHFRKGIDMCTWNGLCREQRKSLHKPLLLAIMKVKFKLQFSSPSAGIA